MTMTPVDKDGFQIRGSIYQPSIGADWTISVSLYRADLAAIDDADESATFTASSKVPFNEAGDEAAITVKLQALVDMVFDTYVPAP